MALPQLVAERGLEEKLDCGSVARNERDEVLLFNKVKINKAECQRIDAFELWCWRSLFRVLGLQREPTSPSERRSVLGVHWKD